MAHDIIIVKDDTKQYWEDSMAYQFGAIAPDEWEALLFGEMKIKTFSEFEQEGSGRETYLSYYAEQIADLEKRFPLIARFKDFYRDAVIPRVEMEAFQLELRRVRSDATQEPAIRLLDQLLAASDYAIRHDASIRTAAD